MDKLDWNAYRFFRQEVKREIRIAEKEYVRSELSNSKGNTNSIWKVINRCIRKKNAQIPASEDPMAQANMYNDFYTSVGKTIAEKAQILAEKLGFTAFDSNGQSNEDMSECSSHQEFYFRPVTEQETLKIVMALPSNKAPGADKVTARILKASVPVTLPLLTNLINCSFRSGIFAESWRLAEVVPCIKDKEGDRDDPSNSRPISLLPITSKVCERAAHSQLVRFLQDHSIIHPFQSGNRKSHSTESALIYFTDEILKNMDGKHISVVVLLDMTKAFDSIRHDILLAKLRRIGISSSALAWFSSYLSGRKQVVRIGNTVSEQLELRFGVPQGSILGPVLFTLYVNELLSIPNHCQSMGYVDDTKLLLALPPNQTADAVSMLNDDLREITKWCCRNSLLLNPDKTKLLVIGVPQLTKTLPTLSVTLMGKKIEPVTTAKDLGVYIDKSLNYNDHINKISSSCIYKLMMINRISYLLDRESLLLLIHSFVFNKLLYCSSVWSNTSKKNIKKLQLLQNFAARIVLGLRKYDHISDGLKTLGWLDINQKLRFNDCVMMYKCLNKSAPAYLSQRFKKRSQIHSRTTRNCNDLELSKCRLATGQRSFSFRGAKIWNELPKSIRDATSLNTFKKNLLNLFKET